VLGLQSMARVEKIYGQEYKKNQKINWTCYPMVKTFIQKERDQIFHEITIQYRREGYSRREARRFAKLDTDDIMADKETFVDNFIRDTWEDQDE